jgi:hypothetical protein
MISVCFCFETAVPFGIAALRDRRNSKRSTKNAWRVANDPFREAAQTLAQRPPVQTDLAIPAAISGLATERTRTPLPSD